MFKKAFPKRQDKHFYPVWEEVALSEEEEAEIEESVRIENMRLMDQCISDAEKIFEKKDLKKFQSDIIRTAIALFEKRASHVVFHKETKTKEKFDKG